MHVSCAQCMGLAGLLIVHGTSTQVLLQFIPAAYLGGVHTTTLLYEYGDFSYSFSPKRFTRSCFSSFYQQKLIIHVECGHAVFGKH